MWFSIELQATTPVPEWDDQPVRMAQEEDAIVGATGRSAGRTNGRTSCSWFEAGADEENDNFSETRSVGIRIYKAGHWGSAGSLGQVTHHDRSKSKT